MLETGARGTARPTLLLLHGWMATASLNWYRALSFLGAEFHVVAPDLRGHGRHGLPAPRFTMEAAADDTAELAAQLALGPVVAVGYSMGGAVAQVLARRHPEVVRGLVLCATAATFTERSWRRPVVRLTGRAGGALSRAFPAFAQAILLHYLRRSDSAGEAGGRGHSRWALDERARSSPGCFIEAGAALNRFDSRHWLAELRVPTCVVVTTGDRRVPPWRQDTLAALVPGARRLTVDAGHDAAVGGRDVFLPVLRRACLIAAACA